MHIAIAQICIDCDSRANNQRRALSIIGQAADLDPSPEVLCLPARCDYGSDPRQRAKATMATADTFVEVLSAKAREMGVSVVVGFTEREDQQLFDTAVWCDADGDVALRRRRSDAAVADTNIPACKSQVRCHQSIFGRVGLLIGDEVLDHALLASHKAMETQAVFAPCGLGSGEKIDDQILTAAREYRLWMVIADSAGESGGNGQSRIINPQGEISCQANSPAETIFTFKLELENSASC